MFRIGAWGALIVGMTAVVACDQALRQEPTHNSSAGTGNSQAGDNSVVPQGGSGVTVTGGSGGSAGGDAAGSAGTPSGGSAGSGGGDTGGSAGSVSSGGGGGVPVYVDPCAPVTGTRTKTDLTPTDGRITCAQDDFGIQGDWKLNTFDNAKYPMVVDFSGSKVCTSGTMPQVIPTPPATTPDYGYYWGTGVALVMHNEAQGGSSEPYNATTNGLGGISAKISGKTIPKDLRFKFKMIGSNDDYCMAVTGATDGQTITLHLSDAINNCWASTHPLTLDPTNIENYEVQVVSNTTAAVPFDFCLSAITALPQ